MLAGFEGGNMEKARAALGILAKKPPQSLLIEGGSEALRLEAGQYWAMAANCPAALSGKQSAPCLSCPVCRQIAAMEFPDLYVFDGEISNTEDMENPGRVRALRMENIRNLKVVLGSAPRGEGRRVVIIMGMTAAREEAMNSLLKILEEPSESTLFVLLASQRERILPTLVSRSFCLALPRSDCFSLPDQDIPLTADLAVFLRSGSSFLDKIVQKGAVDASLAASLILECQKALARAMTGRGGLNPLDQILEAVANDARAFSQACAWMDEAHALLQAGVNPVRALEAFSVRLRELLSRGPKSRP